MADAGILEREIEKRVGEKPQSEEELRHRAGMSEAMEFLRQRSDATGYDETPPYDPAQYGDALAQQNYAREQLFSDRPSYSGGEQTLFDRAPAYQNPQAAMEHHAPVVPNSPDAPSAAQRIADYVPLTHGMQELRRFGDQTFTPTYASAVQEAPAPAERERKAGLFENYTYRNGELLDATQAPQKEYESSVPTYAPTYSPSYMPENVPYGEEESDDALPTRRTLETIHRAEEQTENNSSFLSSLSMRTKLVLISVAAVIIVLIAAICINSAILNSLNGDVAAREERLTDLVERVEDVNGQIGELISEENVGTWAAAHGMTK